MVRRAHHRLGAFQGVNTSTSSVHRLIDGLYERGGRACPGLDPGSSGTSNGRLIKNIFLAIMS
jgi:hypothetical protein